MKKSNASALIIFAAIFAACDGDDPDADAPIEVAVATAALTGEAEEASEAQVQTAGMLASLGALDSVRDLIDGPPAAGSSDHPCHSVARSVTPPELTVTLNPNDSADCIVQDGQVVVTREGSVGSKYVLIAIGSKTAAVATAHALVYGHVKIDRSGGTHRYYSSTASGIQWGTQDCSDEAHPCLVVCRRTDGRTTCPDDRRIQLGLSGTMLFDVQVAADRVDVDVNGTGRARLGPDRGHLDLKLGNSATNECDDSDGFAGSRLLRYGFVNRSPVCRCPSGGTISFSGPVGSRVGLTCGGKALDLSLRFDPSKVELDFRSCGSASAGACPGTRKVIAAAQNLVNCGVSGAALCNDKTRDALGCISDCSKCSFTKALDTLTGFSAAHPNVPSRVKTIVERIAARVVEAADRLDVKAGFAGPLASSCGS